MWPLSDNSSSSCGTAVISLDLPSTATWPSSRRCSADQAWTICSGDLPVTRSNERRSVLPSTATTPRRLSAKRCMKRVKQVSNAFGSSRRNTRLKVSWLSRWPKVLQQVFQPESRRGHGSLATCLLWRQRQEPGSCIVGQGVDGLGLPIGRDELFELAPELIHRAQFGCLLGQPQEPNAQLGGNCLGLWGGMGARAIGQQPDLAGVARQSEPARARQ